MTPMNWFRAVCLVAPLVAALPASAQTAQQKPAQPALGAVGGGWSAEVRKDPVAPANAAPAPSPAKQDEVVRRINDYFNGIVHLQGTFLQVDANNQRTKGKFYVQRPGRVRFDYALPSSLRIVADGKFIAIEDLDLKTIDKYPLESTPFRLLLASDVDLFRDARIVSVQDAADSLTVEVEDKSEDASGRIRLSFEKSQPMRLKEWVITDQQGLDTRITVANLVEGKELSTDFFKPTPTQFPSLGLQN